MEISRERFWRKKMLFNEGWANSHQGREREKKKAKKKKKKSETRFHEFVFFLVLRTLAIS